MPRYHLGIDIGGTDARLLDEETGAIRIDKVSTTRPAPLALTTTSNAPKIML
jgi:N-methylhydantoinase A/oxoprolinase/acetone carboxylase beta subunit